MVAPELTPFALHATLLVTLPRSAELRLKSRVRPEPDEPSRLFALVAAQNVLYRAP